MKAWLRYARPLLAATMVVAAVTACDETLEGGIACPSLCPAPSSQVRDTTLLPVVVDTTIAGFPSIGSETEMILATRGDSFDARAVIRFDTLSSVFTDPKTGVDSNVSVVDSAMLLLKVSHGDTLGPPVTVELYDVDSTAGDDTTAAFLVPMFTASHLLGTRTFPAESLYTDTLRVPIDNAKLLDKIVNPDVQHRLRIGVRVTAPTSVEIRLVSQNGGYPQYLRYRVSADTAVRAELRGAYSSTPTLTALASDLADFQIVAKAPPDEPAATLRVGGVPAKRVYMRFSIPTEILDSSSVIRAQLLMTQRPAPSAPDALDSTAVRPFAVAAGTAITDLHRLLQFIEGGQDSVLVVPAASRVVPFEILGLLRAWRGTDEKLTPRAIALRAASEGTSASFVDFYSNEAAEALRPRLKIYYVPRRAPGLQ